MQAVIINEFGGVDKLTLTEVANPQIGEAEVLVRIKAAGINPVDWKIRSGKLQGRVPHEFPIILGWEFAGEIVECGFAARNFAVGDEVYAYCRRPIIKHGSYAEYIAIPESYLAYKPNNLTFAQAACVPLAALTAYQSLYTAANLQAGETVLILGASGGVGSFAVQLAKLRGAKVIGLASAANAAYLTELGASALDYNTDFVAACRELEPSGVDVVFDCYGDPSLTASYACLRAGGRMVSLRATEAAAEWQDKIQFHYVFVEPNASQLQHLTKLFESQQLSVTVSKNFTLQQVQDAHKMSELLHTKGKIALIIA